MFLEELYKDFLRLLDYIVIIIYFYQIVHCGVCLYAFIVVLLSNLFESTFRPRLYMILYSIMRLNDGDVSPWSSIATLMAAEWH